MHRVTPALRGPRSAALPAGVLDILWVAASLQEGVEHLHAKHSEQAEVGCPAFFVKAAAQDEAAASARRVVSRALESSPALTARHLLPGLL